MSTISRIARSMTAAAFAATCFPVHAYVNFIDNFKVVSNGVTILDDTFGDGLLPPSAQGCTLAIAPNCYGIDPTPFIASETNGKLRLDTSFGSLSETATGDPRQVVRATLLTARTADPANGLKLGNTFSVSGVYDLAVPGPGDSAQIRLTDAHANPADPGHRSDFLQLQIRRATTPGAVPQIRLLEQNFENDTITTNATTPIDFSLNADQIRLTLTHGTANSTAVTASWEYLSNGAVVGTGSFAEVGNIFDGEQWTRADFIVSAAPIPEPETYALMLLGLGAVAWRVRAQRPGTAARD